MKSLWNSRGAVVAVLVVTACTSGRRSGSSADDAVVGLDDSTVVADAVATDDAPDPEDATSPGDIDVPPGDVVVDPCANGGGCDPNATCAADGDARTCTCVQGWIGPGTTCSYDGVIIRDIDTFEAGGFTTSLPADPTVHSKLVLVSMAGGIPTTYPLGAPVEGLYYVPGVPEGPYELQLWLAPKSTIVGAGPTVVILVSSERVLSIGSNFSFRAGTTILTQPTTVTVSGPLHDPWETPTVLDDGSSSELEDELLIYSGGVYLNSVATTEENEGGEPIGPRRGDSAIEEWTIDIDATSTIGDARALDGSLGDELVLAHVRQGLAPKAGTPFTGFQSWKTLGSWFAVPNATLPDGGNLSVEGAFQTTGESSVSVNYAGDAFGALIAPFAGQLTFAVASFTLLMEKGDPVLKAGPFASLVVAFSYGDYAWADSSCNGDLDPCDESLCPGGCSSDEIYVLPGEMEQTFTYANPFDYGQLIASGTLAFSFRVGALLPHGESSDSVRGSLSTSDALVTLTASPIKPIVGLPRDIRVAGLDVPVTALRRGVGFTPELTWTAPTLGVPSNYRVQLWELTDLESTSGGVNARRLVLTARLAGTSLRIPSGILAPGRVYYVDITANVDPLFDPATPYAVYAANSSATMPSGPFAPCACDPNAACTVDPAGQESCKCKDGWTGDGDTCIALPCTLNNGGCAPDATCTNGEPAICTCPDGLLHFPWGECGVDPCAQGNGGCPPEAVCDGSTGAPVCSCGLCSAEEYCDAVAACVAYGERCEAPLVLVDTVTGSTSMSADDHVLDDGNPCFGVSIGADAPDMVYQYTASVSGDFTFTLEAEFDGVLSVRPDCDLGCYGASMDRDFSGRFSVTVSLEAGASVYVVVDGYANDLNAFSGPFTLTVSAASDTLTCEAPPPDVGSCTSGDPCVCRGCLDDGVCSATDDDCVCADCSDDAFCSDPSSCNGDGVCVPYVEGCSCADCLLHPACSPG